MSLNERRGYPLVRNTSNENLAIVINDIRKGQLNITSTITLTASTTNTTLIDERIHPNSYIQFMAETANAAVAKEFIWISDRVNGQCKINHVSNAAVDQDFSILIIG